MGNYSEFLPVSDDYELLLRTAVNTKMTKQQLFKEFGAPVFGAKNDSQNDIPLLSAVTHPVATNPNALLAAHATAQGWPILNLFDD